MPNTIIQVKINPHVSCFDEVGATVLCKKVNYMQVFGNFGNQVELQKIDL